MVVLAIIGFLSFVRLFRKSYFCRRHCTELNVVVVRTHSHVILLEHLSFHLTPLTTASMSLESLSGILSLQQATFWCYQTCTARFRVFSHCRNIANYSGTAPHHQLVIRDLKQRRRTRRRRRTAPQEDWVENVVHVGKIRELSTRLLWTTHVSRKTKEKLE